MKSTLKNTKCIKIKAAICLFSLLSVLTACQPNQNVNNDIIEQNIANQNQRPDLTKQFDHLPNFVIDKDTVYLSTQHIFSIKAKRYQPSLGLHGTITPTLMTSVFSPSDVVVHEVLLTPNQTVSKGDALMVLQTLSIKNQALAFALVPLSSMSKYTNQAYDLSNVESLNNDDLNNDDLNNQAISSDGLSSSDLSSSDLSSSDLNNSNLNNNDLNNIDLNSKPLSTATKPTQLTPTQGQLLTLKAPSDGRVDYVYAQKGKLFYKGQTLINLSDATTLQFIATLPLNAESQISVGQAVNFSIIGSQDTFTGQVSKIVPDNTRKLLIVTVEIITPLENLEGDGEQNPTNQPSILNITNSNLGKLKTGISVIGRVDYGQIEVGTIVPKVAIQDASPKALASLTKPPYHALLPIPAKVWIIGHDQRLSLQPVNVIEYDPESQQYLLSGISNDGLICLAALPHSAEGKRVEVK